MRQLLAAAIGLATLVGAGSCGPGPDLSKTLAVTDVFSGWYDVGVTNGLNRLVPSISFRLQNTGTAPLTSVQLTVSFWRDGEDGEWDSKEVSGIGSKAVAPGASTDPILVRGEPGYTIQQPREEMFAHSMFKDATAKLFAKRGGKITPLGEFKLERRILPHFTQASARP